MKIRKKIVASLMALVLMLSFSAVGWAATYVSKDAFYTEKDSGGGVYNMTDKCYIYKYAGGYRLRVTGIRVSGGTYSTMRITNNRGLASKMFTTVTYTDIPDNGFVGSGIDFTATLTTNGSMAGASGEIGVLAAY